MATVSRFALYLFIILCAPGCTGGRRQTGDSRPALSKESIGRLIQCCTVIVKRGDQEACLGTVIGKRDQQYFVLTSIMALPEDEGITIIHWQSDESGQKFVRREIADAKVIQRKVPQQLAIICFETELTLPVASLAQAEPTTAIPSSFTAWTARALSLRPVEAEAVNVAERRLDQDYFGNQIGFWRLDRKREARSLGAPLINEQGELVGVALKTAGGNALYCDDLQLRRTLQSLGLK